LPTGNAPEEIEYSSQDYTDVDDEDAVFVCQDADAGDYAIHWFRQTHSNNTDKINVSVVGKTSVSGTVSLEMYDNISPGWELIDSELEPPTGGATFTVSGTRTGTEYFDGSNRVICRLYQENSI
jgi:hypothetical protein